MNSRLGPVPGTSQARREDVRLARAYLSAVAEPPAGGVGEFVAEHGVVEAARRIRDGTVVGRVADEVEARRTTVSAEAVLASAERSGLRLVTPEDDDWPTERFACFAEATAVGIAGVAPPLALWVRGSGSVAGALDRSCAVVGARAASGYGEHLAAEWAHGLASAGITVVSGAAYGIDGAAHRGALAARRTTGDSLARGSTVAFLACGLDVDYPAGHARLLAAIAETGLVISEYPPGASPRKHRFLVRNRLIAGAGAGTVVVEAGARSGAGNTASTAEALGHPVMAAPGPVSSATSVGCHDMIRSGKAVLVTRTEDVLELITPLGLAADTCPRSPERVTDQLDPVARRVHEVLCEGGSAEQLAVDSGLPLRKVRAVLPMLEIAGLARRDERGWSPMP